MGFLYFLYNPSIPGKLKIGYTTGTIEKRLRDLHSTGVPEPFQLGSVFCVENNLTMEGLSSGDVEMRSEDPIG